LESNDVCNPEMVEIFKTINYTMKGCIITYLNFLTGSDWELIHSLKFL
jgi:hypothetical protein